MKTENLSTLKIHKLTQAQYERELANGNIDETALYLTPQEEIDLTSYATKEELDGKANTEHNHNDVYYTEAEIDSLLLNKANTSHNHDTAYDAKGSADTALASAKTYSDENLATAKSYTDTKTSSLASTSVVDTKINTHNASATAHSDIRDLITTLTTRLNALADSDDTTLDQLSEIVAYIKSNRSLIENVTTNKINVSDIVDNLTTNSGSKVLSAAQGVAIKGLIDALQASLDSHTENATVHITSTERTNWNAAKTHADSAHAPSNAEKNQNAFSNITVGSTTVTADSATDTVTFAGSNVTITPDATNDKITFTVADSSTSTKGVVQLTDSTSSTSTTTAATPNSVKSAYDLANTVQTNLDSHTSNTSNPHSVTKEQVGLGNVDNTSDADKPVSNATQTALDGKMNKNNPVGNGYFLLGSIGDGTELGDLSITAGLHSAAYGDYSQATGYRAVANGDYSHAEGAGTVANGGQHVQGNYNIEDTDGDYAHIVGNGSIRSNSNAHTLDWDGNAWFAGDVYVGSTSGINKDEGSVKLVSTTDLDNYVFITTDEIDEICGNTLIVNAAELTF